MLTYPLAKKFLDIGVIEVGTEVMVQIYRRIGDAEFYKERGPYFIQSWYDTGKEVRFNIIDEFDLDFNDTITNGDITEISGMYVESLAEAYKLDIHGNSIKPKQRRRTAEQIANDEYLD